MVDIGYRDMNAPDSVPDYSPFPPGVYTLVAVSSELKNSSKPGNRYLNYTFEVLDGVAKGRKHFEMFNLWNTNATAAGIADRDFKALGRACGKAAIKDSSELHGIPFKAEIGVQPPEGKYSAKNKIEKYIPADGTTPVVQAAPVALSAAAPWSNG